MSRPRAGVTLPQLLGVVLSPAALWLRRRVLLARLRSLQGLALYFEMQQEHARAGLADTHKRMAMARSEINAFENQKNGWNAPLRQQR